MGHDYKIEQTMFKEDQVFAKKIKYVFQDYDLSYRDLIKGQLAELVVREPYFQMQASAIPSDEFVIPEFYSVGVKETPSFVEFIFRMEFIDGAHIQNNYQLMSDANQWLLDHGIHHNDLVDMHEFGSMNRSNVLAVEGRYAILDFGNASDINLMPRLG
jgi:hypothetical protein